MIHSIVKTNATYSQRTRCIATLGRSLERPLFHERSSQKLGLAMPREWRHITLPGKVSGDVHLTIRYEMQLSKRAEQIVGLTFTRAQPVGSKTKELKIARCYLHATIIMRSKTLQNIEERSQSSLTVSRRFTATRKSEI